LDLTQRYEKENPTPAWQGWASLHLATSSAT